MNFKKIKYGVLALLPLMVILLMSFLLPPDHITLYMAGDSTMSIKDVKAYPETGWGMPFKAFFDQTVTVDNKAKNGRSTKSFIAEGLWASIADNLNEGDYVIIEFGHNDEVPTKATYTPPGRIHCQPGTVHYRNKGQKSQPCFNDTRCAP